MRAQRRLASPTANPVGADATTRRSSILRPNNLRALGVPGALLSTSILAVAPSVAVSDTQSGATAAPATTTATAAAAPKTQTSLTVSHVRRDVLAGRKVLVRGTLRPAGAGRAVSLQISRPGGGWTMVDHDRTDSAG